jgi:hypothetical protein
MMKVARPLVALALLLFAPPAGAQQGGVIDRVLAVVGGQVVSLSDARAVLAFKLVEPRRGVDPIAEALDYLVNRQLMLGEVDRYSAPSPDAAALRQRMEAVRARFPDKAAYEEALTRSALTETRLRDLVGDNIRIENYLEQRFSAAAQPTLEEVERYYLDHRANFTVNGRVLPLEEVQAEAFARVSTERRNFLIADWLDRLRRRAAITDLYRSSSTADR